MFEKSKECVQKEENVCKKKRMCAKRHVFTDHEICPHPCISLFLFVCECVIIVCVILQILWTKRNSRRVFCLKFRDTLEV